MCVRNKNISAFQSRYFMNQQFRLLYISFKNQLVFAAFVFKLPIEYITYKSETNKLQVKIIKSNGICERLSAKILNNTLSSYDINQLHNCLFFSTAIKIIHYPLYFQIHFISFFCILKFTHNYCQLCSLKERKKRKKKKNATLLDKILNLL